MKKILAYSDVVSVMPGDSIQFMVSCEDATTFHADFMRIRSGDNGPDAPGYKDEPVETPAAREYPGRKQAFNPGSYVHVPHATIFESLTSFTAQAYVYPTMSGPGSQAIIAKLSPDGQTGFALMIDNAGAPVLELRHGDGVEHHATDEALTLKEWAFLAASYDAESGSIQIYQESLKARFAPPPWQGTSAYRMSFDTAAPLTMGAILSDGDAPITHAFNGCIDSPRMSNSALNRADMAMIVDHSPSLRLQRAIVGAWDFSREISSDTKRLKQLEAFQLTFNL